MLVIERVMIGYARGASMHIGATECLGADDLSPLLDPIGFTVSGTGGTRPVALPSWRLDSTAAIDVVAIDAARTGD